MEEWGDVVGRGLRGWGQWFAVGGGMWCWGWSRVAGWGAVVCRGWRVEVLIEARFLIVYTDHALHTCLLRTHCIVYRSRVTYNSVAYALHNMLASVSARPLCRLSVSVWRQALTLSYGKGG